MLAIVLSLHVLINYRFYQDMQANFPTMDTIPRKEGSADDTAWGQLFLNNQPTKRWWKVSYGLANYIVRCFIFTKTPEANKMTTRYNLLNQNMPFVHIQTHWLLSLTHII